MHHNSTFGDLKLRLFSLSVGTMIPPGEHDKTSEVCCKAETPSAHELNLSNRQHRSPAVQHVMDGFFDDLIGKLTEAEVDFLDVLGLPEIDDVRLAIQKEPNSTAWTMPPGANAEIDRIFDEWEEDITSPISENGIYEQRILEAFSVGLAMAFKKILRNVTL